MTGLCHQRDKISSHQRDKISSHQRDTLTRGHQCDYQDHSSSDQALAHRASIRHYICEHNNLYFRAVIQLQDYFCASYGMLPANF